LKYVYAGDVSRPVLRRHTDRWSMRQDVIEVLRYASNEEKNILWAWNLPLLHALDVYHPAAGKDLQRNFWQDARLDGITAALEKWTWLIGGSDDRRI
jgi:hypothetical protein